jgi:hypothetical protein
MGDYLSQLQYSSLRAHRPTGDESTFNADAGAIRYDVKPLSGDEEQNILLAEDHHHLGKDDCKNFELDLKQRCPQPPSIQPTLRL